MYVGMSVGMVWYGMIWYGMAWYNGLYLLWPPVFALPLQPQQYLAAACDHLSVWGFCIPHTAPDFEITPFFALRSERSFFVLMFVLAFLCAVPSSSIASSCCLSQHREDLHKCIERSPPCVPRGLGNVSRPGGDHRSVIELTRIFDLSQTYLADMPTTL